MNKIAKDWLKPQGSLIMDVQNPYIWKKWNGEKEHNTANPEQGYEYDIWQEIKYDPIEKRMYDTWWESDKPEIRHTKTIRCYTIEELTSLLKDTDFKLIFTDVKNNLKDWKNNEYLVQLKLE